MSFGMWLFENKRVMKNVDCIGYVVEYYLFLKYNFIVIFLDDLFIVFMNFFFLKVG